MKYPILLAAVIAVTALASPPSLHAAPVAAETGDQARDHRAILAMAGSFKVRFDMRETVAFVPGYTLYPAKVSGGTEVVRVIADRPDFVSLQHLLVVEAEPGKPMVIKHWRQDWTWQPATLLVYVSKGRWDLRKVPMPERRRAWSQTVWQTDDSPRYGALGRWRYDDGVARWTSGETLRPLARRDATRNPPYDHYAGINRHALLPEGWVHEQDNAKIGPEDGKPATFAHEVVLNSYLPSTDFPVAAADRYWVATRDYWAIVRESWAEVAARRGGIRLEEQPDYGSVTGGELMSFADAVAEGKMTVDEAARKAVALIGRATAG